MARFDCDPEATEDVLLGLPLAWRYSTVNIQYCEYGKYGIVQIKAECERGRFPRMMLGEAEEKGEGLLFWGPRLRSVSMESKGCSWESPSFAGLAV